MRVVIQRVSKASVKVDAEIIGEIDKGLLLFAGIEDADTEEDLVWLANKIANMRIFSDADGKMNLSVSETSKSILLVSQFTLHASTKKGNRPSFIKAGKPDFAKTMLQQFSEILKIAHGLKVEQGQFGADMKISLLNDGPVTIVMDSKNRE